MDFKYQIGGVTLEGNINELREFVEEIRELESSSSSELSSKITDVCFAIEVDYQKFHDLDEYCWDIVHK